MKAAGSSLCNNTSPTEALKRIEKQFLDSSFFITSFNEIQRLR